MSLLFLSAVTIFFAAFIFIISEKIHRTVVALIGAILMILLGIITQEQAIHGIDFNTLGLLVGMMVLVGIAKQSGMFQAVAFWLTKKTKGSPILIFLLLNILVMVFSALLDNVTTVLLLVPVIIVITNNLKISPYPFFVSTILLSNIGGAMTLIGDPPNIMIGSAAGLSFNDFLVNLMPVCALVAIITLGGLILLYRKDMKTNDAARASIMRFSPKEAITDMGLLWHSLIAIGAVVLGFLTHGFTHIEGATIALAGAALLLLLSLRDPEDHLKDIEWPTIFFFIGLFIMVRGIEEVGLIDMAAHSITSHVGDNQNMLVMLILWGSAFMSAVVDNIPFVAAMIPVIHQLGGGKVLWWALALGADIGGNATLVGASANVIVAGLVKKETKQHMSFLGYMRIAVPFTLLALIIISGYLY
ncbi:ArsB/NhaD family transporter, partial [Patescibacteria group bacterium]|nr:ArsB/NhaD family transporter [Patescibacteria group bacterium]